MNKKGFTLMELIVVMGILAVVMVVIGGMAGFTAGRLKSNQLKVVNDSLRSTLDLIGQKMNNANEKVKISNVTRYGFYYKDDVLVIISGDYANNIYCTYFGKKDDALAIDQETATPAGTCPLKAANSLSNIVTPDKIKVTEFSVSDIKIMENTDYKDIPKIKVKLSGYNTTDKANAAVIPGAPATLETTFTMDGENVKWLNNN